MVLPVIGGKSSSDQHSPKKRKIFELKSTFQSVKSQLPLHHCVWLLITVFFQMLVLLLLIRSSKPSNALSTHQHLVAQNPDCQSGMFYVYDLPPIFNSELVANCHELDLWKSQCNAVSNAGFGPIATGLESIVPRNLSTSWYWTDMYAAEVIYHNRMLNHRCRTLNPDVATGYYIPFYAGLAIGKYLFSNFTAKDRDRLPEMVLDWLKEQPSWKRANGADHFILFGRLTWAFRRLTDSDSDWGSSFIYMPLMRNVLRLSVEKNPWDELEESVPYPTGFHPESDSQVLQWQNFVRNRKRNSLFSFVGAKREKIQNDFRAWLMEYCRETEGDSCNLIDCGKTFCSNGAPAILEAFLDSEFCLQPRGDGLTRRSMFDCMVAGSIPVIFWRGSFQDQYIWHLPWISDTYSVFIDHRDVRNGTADIRRVLEGYSREKVLQMRETLIQLMPKILYARSSESLSSIRDAFDITIERALRKLNRRREIVVAESRSRYAQV